MARNKVRLQRGLSDVEFERLYGTEENAARRFSPGVGRQASRVPRAEARRTASWRSAHCGSAAPDSYLGGERSGGKRGRGSPGKAPFLAAVETAAMIFPP